MSGEQRLIFLLASALAGLGLGWVVWSWSDRAWMAALALIPVVVSRAPCRFSAWTFAMGYWTYTSRDVPLVLQRFENLHVIWSYMLVLAYCAFVSWILAQIWSRSPARSAARLGCASLVLTLPPLGGWVFGQPILASGWVFPGSGIWGLLGLTCVWMLLARFRAVTQTTMIGAATIACSFVLHASSEMAPDIAHLQTTTTSLPRYPQTIEQRHQYHDSAIQQVKDVLASSPDDVTIVLPESIAGLDEARYSWRWLELQAYLAKKNQTLLVGIDLPVGSGVYQNALRQLNTLDVASAASVPAPIGSWRPWANSHFPARWFQSYPLDVAGQRVVVLFCWEQLVPWPWILSRISSGESSAILSVSNHWFASDTEITEAHMRSAESIARLAGVPLAKSINLPAPQ